MKLEIKHLAPYLPYRLKLESQNLVYAGNPPEPSHEEMIIEELTPDNLSIHLKGFSKPLLHPLSSLTETIEVNGKEFVPFEKLMELSDAEEIQIQVVENDFLLYEPIVDEFGANTGKSMSYGYYQQLFAWHIDVFGLVDHGLALPIER